MATKLRKHLSALSASERGCIDEWAQRWIAIGLRTSPADRTRFEQGACECYRYAEIAWPNNTVWVSSPLVLALAAPVATFLIELVESAAQRMPLNNSAVASAVPSAVASAGSSAGFFWGFFVGLF